MDTVKNVNAAVEGSLSRSQGWHSWRYTLVNYIFILPFLVFFFVFLLGPMLYSLYMSVHRWELLMPERPFIGIKNFQELFKDDRWWTGLINTIYFSCLTSALVTFFSFLTANLIYKRTGINQVLRVIYYAPNVVSSVVMGYLMRWVFNDQLGIVNYILKNLGFAGIPWLSHQSAVIPTLSLASLWWGLGFPMIIFIAALNNIPDDYYEAAKIDGASDFQQTWFITLPLLRRAFLFIVATQLIAHFQVFAQPYIMTGGGPGLASFTVIMYLYQTAWTFFRMGYATTIAVALSVVIFVFTLVQFRIFRERHQS